ncbi:M14 family zinc carboxypeptidase [Amycolatopsis anabasis]|uniref:M14 family zinc carboxypeptidase n=1 Tax=Amycolatopsis anabasis TaxID=1840409 RepID=UPI001FE6C062|nr:M14 family zinc carboxypeptidase [Amycolatopsis anabasis]
MRSFLLPIAALTLAATLTAPAAAAPDDRISLVRVDASPEQVAALGLDAVDGTADVVLHGRADAEHLRQKGFRWHTLVADLTADAARTRAADAAYARSVAVSTLPSGRTAYRAFADYDTDLDRLASTYPKAARTFTLPHRTLENRTVRGLEISHDVAASAHKPVLVVTGVHHAREWPSSEVTLEFAYDLLKNDGTDARVTGLLDQLRVVVVPMVNPDGFAISRGLTYEMKRKNCRVRDGQLPGPGECAASANRSYGVDPNRNYGAAWGDNGSSANRGSETYRGAGPFSEPEVTNVRDLVSGLQATALISNHTYGEVVLRPAGPEEDLYSALGTRLSSANGYGSSALRVGGMTERWSYYATAGFGFTVEIGTGNFHPAFGPGVVDQYMGTGTRLGLRELYLRAAEAAADRTRHGVLTGSAPAGSTLRITKDFTLTTATGQPVPTHLESALTVPSGGRFTWDVNPSTRPAENGMLDESWTLTCAPPGKPVAVTTKVLVRRGQQVPVDLAACAA